MIDIEELTVDEIARILVLERADDGLYHCPLPYHEGSKNGVLEINSKGCFKCSCGLVGIGLVELTSNLYGIDKSKAEEWLRSRLDGDKIG